MWNDRFYGEGLRLRGMVFDPTGGFLTAGSMAMTAIGGASSAAGTIAGGNYAATAGQMQKTAAYAKADEQDFEAKQTDQNASQAFAAGQREMLETQQRTSLAQSTSRARASASGVDAGVGSAAENEGAIAQRGSYHALMDLFNGESAATGLRNQATAQRYGATITRYGGDAAAWEGQAKKSASELSAVGTIAGSAGSMLKQYGAYAYPNLRGSPGASF